MQILGASGSAIPPVTKKHIAGSIYQDVPIGQSGVLELAAGGTCLIPYVTVSMKSNIETGAGFSIQIEDAAGNVIFDEYQIAALTTSYTYVAYGDLGENTPPAGAINLRSDQSIVVNGGLFLRFTNIGTKEGRISAYRKGVVY